MFAEFGSLNPRNLAVGGAAKRGGICGGGDDWRAE